MKVKALTLTVLLIYGIFTIAGCTCEPQTAKEEAMQPYNPCTAARMETTEQSYPVTARSGSAVHLQKMAPREIIAGEEFDYRIKVQNLTDRTLDNVVVTDQIPSNFKIIQSDPQVSNSNNQMVQWFLGSLMGNDSQVINATAVVQGTGEIRSCADVKYDTQTCALMAVVEPKIALTKNVPTEVLTCDRIPITYTITNTGSGYACDLKIEDDLGENLMTSEGDHSIEHHLDSLGPGESEEIEIMVDATQSGTYSSRAYATTRGKARVESNMPRIVVTQPMLAINQSCPGDQFIGRKMDYNITVSNQGDGIAKDTIIVANVPEQAQFDSATHNGQFSRSSPGKVQWQLGDLKPGETINLSMQLHSSQPGSVHTHTEAQAYCAETVSSACETLLSGIPAILLEVVDVSDPIEVGSNETYQITATNQGSAVDKDVQITCKLEGGMEYVSSQGPTQASVMGQTITFAPLESLGPKEKATWQVTVKALSEGDMRFEAHLTSDMLSRPVQETEATRFYK